jgi:hypothetical protein
MTIYNDVDIEPDLIKYKMNDIKEAIENNEPIEEKLHMVICVSNVVQYESRYILAKKFIKRIENEEKNVILYIVELAYDLPNQKPQKFFITKKDNPRHLQLRTNTPPLWHKENLLNIGIKKLLPNTWKAVCWADADILFQDPNWAINTLKILNGTRDIVQNFHLCVDMDADENAMSIFSSFGYQYTYNRPYQKGGNPLTQWHPGYVWSCTRKAYEQMGGLIDVGIVGAGDNHMSLSWINNGIKSVHEDVSDGYKQSILEYQERCQGLIIGYVEGVIKHEFHGKKSDRKYQERWQILVKNSYNPYKHITYNKDGLLIPTKDCPQKLLDGIYNYFTSRNEDLGIEKLKELSLKD